MDLSAKYLDDQEMWDVEGVEFLLEWGPPVVVMVEGPHRGVVELGWR